nr:DNA-3-methyladenine glycosylase [Flavimobilis soli]
MHQRPHETPPAGAPAPRRPTLEGPPAASGAEGRLPVSRRWFVRPVLDVAHGLLDAHLVRTTPDGRVTLRVTEVEAYAGETDPASHAFRGLSRRNATMFGPPGRLYVYRHMGLHHCANVVGAEEGTARAVLLRAGEVVEGADLATARRQVRGVVRSPVDLARGPARLADALGLTLADDGADLLTGEGLELLVREHAVPAGAVETGPRVGVGAAGADPERFPWRLWLAGDPTVSQFRGPSQPRRRTGQTSAVDLVRGREARRSSGEQRS